MALIVTGLSAKALYINNPIPITLTEDTVNSNVLWYTMNVINAGTQQSQGFKLQPANGGSLTVDIAAIIKSMFKKPKHNEGTGNYEHSAREVFNFAFTSTYTLIGSPTKYSSSKLLISGEVFFRGGKRGHELSVQVAMWQKLRHTPKIPAWGGYQVLEYQAVGADYEIEQIIPFIGDVEKMKTKGCNPVFVKFLNSLAGYSFWLFEGINETTSTENSGYSDYLENITDFGNTVEKEIELYSKVPARYHSMMLDLIESPEIYIYNQNPVSYERLVSKSNSIVWNNFEKVYEVKLKFERVINYNPEILWQ